MKTVEFIKRELPYAVNEELKQLRTNIKFCGDDKRVIMLTSSISGEGKSTVAIDLAKSFKELGAKVLLIDTDMRKSYLKHYVRDYRHQVHYGLSHYLTGQCKLNEAMYKTEEEVYVVFAGPVPPNPSELLSNKRMENLIAKSRDLFDYIIIDCPPIGAVIDAAIVSKLCDGAIIVVEAGKVSYRMAQGVKEQLDASGCPILGVVLNKVDLRKKGRYYKSYYYYKKYGYYSKYSKQYGNGQAELGAAEDEIDF